ncbi:hypothetical protein CRYUN_Cryun09bG0148000 [Craigia yunnanensis]
MKVVFGWFNCTFPFNSLKREKKEEKHSDGDLEDDNDKSVSISGEAYLAKKILPNGDYYTGQWYDNFPNEQGKYLWTDECMYLGEFHKGKSMGRGRFCWPSSATYEREFNSRYRDGAGIYTGSNGDTYKGQWMMNLKHGHSIKHYLNGDWYDGKWHRDLQEGQGKYQWQNENHYVGEWKNGNWSKDPNEQNGIYYPSESSLDVNLEWDPKTVYKELADCKICPGERVSILPS